MSALAGDFDKKDYVKLVRLNFWVESISPEKSLQRSILYLCKIVLVHVHAYTLDVLFSSNHNIHKSSSGLCFWASDPLIERF